MFQKRLILPGRAVRLEIMRTSLRHWDEATALVSADIELKRETKEATDSQELNWLTREGTYRT